jgi:hypothetical protein
VYEHTATREPYVATSTLWFNPRGQVIRVDGWWVEDSGEIVPAPYYITYDDQGRLAEERSKVEVIGYLYAPEEITVRSNLGGNSTYTLVDGRAVHFEGPESAAPQDRLMTDYTYDDQGRLTSYSGVSFYDAGRGRTRYTFGRQYTYDAQGRAVTVRSMQDGISKEAYAFSYSQTPQQLRVEVKTLGAPEPAIPLQRWTYDFDADHRIIRSAVESNYPSYHEVVDTYQYLDGEIDVRSSGRSFISTRANGACDPPVVVVSDRVPLPLRWWANYDALPNAAAEEFDAPFH